MKMSEHDADSIQFDMYLAAIDDTSNCPLMFCGGAGINDTKEDRKYRWIRSVNSIYRLLCCKLWTAKNASPYMPGWLAGYNLNNNYDFCKVLSEYSPFVPNEINMRYWMEPLLCNTDFGQSFVESFGIKNLENDVYPPFIEALEDIFRKNGVPWEAGDFFGMDANIK